VTTVRVDRNVPPGLPRRSAKPAPGQLCLLVVGGPDTGAWVPLLPGTTEVGRQAPIRLTDQSLSQPHFRLTVGEGTQLALEDRGSRGGTTVDGVAVSGRRPLEPGSVISAGGTRLAVAIAPSADAALTPAGDGTLDFYRPPRLRVPVGFGRVAFPSDPRPPNRAPVQLFAMLTPVLAAAAMAQANQQISANNTQDRILQARAAGGQPQSSAGNAGVNSGTGSGGTLPPTPTPAAT